MNLKWVEPNARTLAAGATHATLLDLVPHTTAPFGDTGELLLPGDGEEVETVGALVAGPGGRSAVALLAPDGSMVIVRMLPNATGAVPDLLSSVDVRSGDGFDLLADAAGTITHCEAVEPCWMLRLIDGGVGANGPWRDPVVELADSIDTDADADGW